VGSIPTTSTNDMQSRLSGGFVFPESVLHRTHVVGSQIGRIADLDALERPSEARVAARDGRHPFHPSPPNKTNRARWALFFCSDRGEAEPPRWLTKRASVFER